MIPYEWVLEARTRISGYVNETPLHLDTRRNLYIKWENRQITGSFKLRGAYNKILNLEPWERERGLVCASAGNHGQAVALVAGKLGCTTEVFVPSSIPSVKLKKMRSLGAKIHLVKGGYGEAELQGLDYAMAHSKTWVSPYNDGQVIAGQGTLALEVLDQLDGIQPLSWLVPIGGGGLISGIGAVTSRLNPKPRLIGIQPEGNAFMYHLKYEDSTDNWQDLPSLADGLTGAVETVSVTIPMVSEVVDDIILVSENEIANAIAYAWHTYGEMVEGSGAVTLAACLASKVRDLPTVVIVSGGNINPDAHAHCVSSFHQADWL